MISLQVYATPSRARLLADFTSRLHPAVGGGGLVFGSDKHGFSSLECPFIPLSLAESFEIYDWPGTPYVIASGQAAETIWEGRLETVSVKDGGIRLGAYGPWRALKDAPYTALWSDTHYGLWRPVTSDDRSGRAPALYEMDNNNRIYMAPRNGESFANGVDFGEFTYAAPHLGGRGLRTFSCSYSMLLPANWTFRIRTVDYAFTTFSAILNEVVATGSAQSGTISISFAADDRLVVQILNNTGSLSSPSGDTGDNFLKLTNVRVKTTTNNALASTIASDLVSFVNGINSSQLSAVTSRIEVTPTDLQDELYEDALPADILDRLALLHDYEAGVWEDRVLHFRPEGSAGRDWYVDVTKIMDLERDLDKLQNSAYAVYRNGRNETQRTAVADDVPSQNLASLIRRGYVNVQTTSSSEAQTHRDTFLADRKDFIVRATIEFERLYDAQGVEHPLHAVRQGDTLTMRNLPPTLSVDIDNIRSFIVGEAEVRPFAREASVTPREAVPTLVTLVARREAGLR